jgi:hypothetical protein
LGTYILVWELLALAILVVIRILVRSAPAAGSATEPAAGLVAGPRPVVFIRRFVTVKTVLLALCGAVVLAAVVTVLVNFQHLGTIKPPYSGVEWATME